MTTYTITSGHDTYAVSTQPNATFAASTLITIGPSTAEPAYIYFPLPAELAGQTVSSAVLSCVAATTNAATTITAALVTSSWTDATLTYNRLPTVGSSVGTAIGGTVAGDQIAITVSTLIQSVASGANWYGLRLTAPLLTLVQSFESGLQAPWVLTIVTQEQPDTPQALVPNGTVVSLAKPFLTCDFVDNGGLSNDMGAMQVQIDPAKNGTSPGFDSGTVATVIPMLDLSATAYAGLASGATTYWRVRVQDTSGLWSGWSDWAGFTYQPLPTLTLLTPAAGVLWDPTSDIIATTSTNMSAYRVQITSATDRTDIKFDSGRTPVNPSALTTIQVTLPETYNGHRILVDDRTYQLHVQAWDTYGARQGTPGQLAWQDSWTTFAFNDDASLTVVSTLVADQSDRSPAVNLTWTRAAAPDAWVVLRDDKVIKRLDPAAVISGVSTYSWTDPNPKPWVQHTYNVKPISGGKQGKKGPTAVYTPDCQGIWIRTQDGTTVWLAGTATDQMVVNDRRNTYKPLNLRYDVDIVTGFEGLSGTFSGLLVSDDLTDDGQDVNDAIDTLLSIRDNPGESVRLIFGLFSGEVLLRNISITPNAIGNSAVPVQTVSFGVNQVGDFDSVL